MNLHYIDIPRGLLWSRAREEEAERRTTRDLEQLEINQYIRLNQNGNTGAITTTVGRAAVVAVDGGWGPGGADGFCVSPYFDFMS